MLLLLLLHRSLLPFIAVWGPALWLRQEVWVLSHILHRVVVKHDKAVSESRTWRSTNWESLTDHQAVHTTDCDFHLSSNHSAVSRVTVWCSADRLQHHWHICHIYDILDWYQFDQSTELKVNSDQSEIRTQQRRWPQRHAVTDNHWHLWVMYCSSTCALLLRNTL